MSEAFGLEKIQLRVSVNCDSLGVTLAIRILYMLHIAESRHVINLGTKTG